MKLYYTSQMFIVIIITIGCQIIIFFTIAWMPHVLLQSRLK